jgi:transcriptional regulator with XRE-family HTH domain
MQEARVALGMQVFVNAPASLAKLRLSRGLSQAQLASAIGTSQPHIAKMEGGSVNLMFDTAGRLADALGVKLDDLRPLLVAAKNA